MITLSQLSNTDRPVRKVQRIGRGIGSKRGKTSCRGAKGDKARCGYKRHFGREGGQLPLYRKLPCRGFDSARFRSFVYAINLSDINIAFNDGETVSFETLRQKGIAPRRALGGLKILSGGELTKKVKIEAHAYSEAAQEKLKKLKVPFKVLAASETAGE
jgi:large subunit ribosomal protein L15